VHARIPNEQPREDPREEKRACRSSWRTSRRGLSCVSGSWQAERAAARRLPLEDPRAEVGEDVRVGVGPKEFKLYHIGLDYCVKIGSRCLAVLHTCGLCAVKPAFHDTDTDILTNILADTSETRRFPDALPVAG